MRRSLCLAALAVLGLGLSAPAAPKPAGRDVQDVVYLGEKGPVLVRLHVRIDGRPLVDVWEAFMGHVFSSLDADGDGVLSPAEAARVPPPAVLLGNGPGFAGKSPNLAAAMDADHDGKITREELARWYRNNGAAPFQFQGGAPQTQLFVTYAGQAPTLSADALNEKLFTLLDADKDGKLSRDELAHAPDVLRKLDLDDDETVSVAEMSGNVGGGGGDLQVVAAFEEVMTRRDTGPFFLVRGGEPSKDLARRLLEHYGRKGQKPPTKSLTRADLGIDEATFAALDADEDGKLDGEELARFALREPDLELSVRLGKQAEGEKAVEVVPTGDGPTALGKSVRTLDGGKVLLELGRTQIELGPAGASADPQYAPKLREQYRAQFRAADRDNNGYLDRGEADRSPLFRNLFAVMDRDGDGKLFEKEVTAYLGQVEELQAGAARCCASLTVREQGRGLFDLADADGDGRLSAREMRRMAGLIASLDRDGDGKLGRDEVPHRYRVEVRRGPSAGNPFAPRVVAVRRMVGGGPQPPEPTAGPLWFRRMDRNRDGDVSRREFLGSDAEFKKIDADGDGLLSAEEADRADKLFRASASRDEKDRKNTLPPGAVWDTRAFNSLFRNVHSDYEAEAKQVKFTVETKEGYRTADFVRDVTRRPFTFRFLDGDGNELATVQLGKDDFRGLPRDRIMPAGTRLTVTLDLPRALPRTKRVVLQRGAP